METTHEITDTQHPFFAGFWLMTAIPISALIGFPVGAPRADERFTMLVVSVLGIWSAALVGSAVFGKVLAASNEQ